MAEWPPHNCRRPVKLEDSSVIMTSSTQNKIKTQCEILDTFSGALYVKFSRIYNLNEQTHSDSTLSFDFLFDGETKFSLEVHNDRLQVIPQEHTDIRINSDACMAVLARHELDWFNWMRVRVNHLSEIGRTFVSVDLVSYEGTTFSPCVRFETNLIDSALSLRLRGYTSSNMRQEVHEITDSKPDLNKYSSSELATRMQVLEKRIQRIHTTLQRYMGYHDEHAKIMSDKHLQLNNQIIMAKNGLQSQSTSHFITYSFIVVLSLISTCWWMTYKIRQSNRVHIL
jgi:uncharacterized small protein (DUF1192 family)